MYDIFFKLFYRNICHLWHNLHSWDFNKRTKHGSLNPGRFLNNKPHLNQLHVCSACLFKKLIPDYLFWMHSFVENNIRRWKKNWQDICNWLFSNHFGTKVFFLYILETFILDHGQSFCLILIENEDFSFLYSYLYRQDI